MSRLLHSNTFSSSTSALSRTKQYGPMGRPCLHRQRAVVAHALDANRLLKKPELPRPEQTKKLFDQQAESASAPSTAPSTPSTSSASAASSGVTIEYQRARAKEMLKYFQQKKQDEAAKKSQLFGWTPANEIGNGRWVMFGVFVGLLTEYATGVDFPRQIGLMLSYLGIVDVE